MQIMEYKKIIQEFHDAAILDIATGVSTIEDVELILRAYEQAEMYLECEGIKRALDFIHQARKNDC